MTDRIVGALLWGLALWYGLEAVRLKVGFVTDPVGPKAFPLLLAGLLALTSTYLLWRPDPEPAWPQAPVWLNAGLALGSLVGYAYLLVPLGFVLATTLEVGFLGLLFGGRARASFPAAFALALGLYALFVWGLGIPLPLGRVFGG